MSYKCVLCLEGLLLETIVTKVKQQLDQWSEWSKASVVMIALSGGVDSVVLLNTIYQINQELEKPKRLILAHFNHRLRKESIDDALFVKKLANKYDVIYYVREWEEPADKNIEASAREARYQFMADIVERESVDVLMTGHHLNDLAETILMRLTRGASLRALRGIDANYRRLILTNNQKAIHVQILRPLISIDKQSLYDYAHQEKLEYVEDLSNLDTKYFRNRIRHQMIPLLEGENPNFLENMLLLQEQLQASYHVHYASYLLDEPKLLMHSQSLHWVLYVPEFSRLEDDKRKLYLTIFFEERLIEDIFNYAKESIDRLDQMILNDRLPNSNFQLNDHWVARREYDYIYIQPKGEIKETKSDHLVHINQLNHWHTLTENEQVGLFDERYYSTAQVLEMDYHLRLYLKNTQLRGFYLRHRKDGDKLELNDGNGDVFHKKVSRFMIDQKLPLNERDKIWILCDEKDEIISIVEHLASRNYRQRHPEAETYLFLYRKTQD